MNVFSRTPWYIAGLAFECTECGRCCAGPEEGYVWLTKDEAAAVAAVLGITPEQVLTRYTRRVGRRYTIVEDRRTKDCIFLCGRTRPDGAAGKGCRIYSCRPTQCRTWPFWPANLHSPDAWLLASERCPGINRGRLFSYDEIEERRIATE